MTATEEKGYSEKKVLKRGGWPLICMFRRVQSGGWRAEGGQWTVDGGGISFCASDSDPPEARATFKTQRTGIAGTHVTES